MDSSIRTRTGPYSGLDEREEDSCLFSVMRWATPLSSCESPDSEEEGQETLHVNLQRNQLSRFLSRQCIKPFRRTEEHDYTGRIQVPEQRSTVGHDSSLDDSCEGQIIS
jgi:hypothetical protein